MKKLFKLIGIIALVAIIGFSFATCSDGNDDTGGGGGGTGGSGGTGGTGGSGGTGGTGGSDNTNLNSWYVHRSDDSTATVEHSIAADGVCTVNVGGTPEKHGVDGVWNAWKINAQINYTAKANTSYIYKFEVWTESGTRGLQVQYYDNEGLVLNENISITSTRKTYTINGKKLPKGGQQRVEFQCAHQTGKFHVKMLEIKEYNGVDWNVWRDDSSTATMEYSIAADGVCTVTVGGTPEKYGADGNHWKIKAENAYTGNAGKRYEYKFEAWTQSGNRNLHVEYYCNNDDSVYLNDTIPITTTRKTYTVIGDVLPKSGKHFVVFQLADQLGTVHLKMLDIKEYNGGSGGDPVMLTLNGDINISPSGTVAVNTQLTATYSGSENVTYQWKKDGNNVGTNSNKYTPTEAGSYAVTVSAAGYNSKTSAAVTIIAILDLSGNITINPSGTVAVNTQLTATYSGSETVTYQWKNGSNNVGTNSNKYTPTTPGNFTVTVSATGYNSKTSNIVTVNAIQLTANTWADGNLPTSSDVQWFKFTATASTQYIHVSFGTLTDLYVQVYNSSGATVGTETNLYSNTKYISRNVTNEQEYYIKVRPYDSNRGTYKIAFNTSTTVPTMLNLSGNITISPSGTVEVNTELTATYSGSETVTYQWKRGNTTVGTNSNKYTPTETGSYSVTVSATGYNNMTSAAVTVVLPVLSGNITISPNSDVTTYTELTATYSGNETVTYQWKKDVNTTVGTNSNKYTPTTAGSYTVTVSATGYSNKTSVAVTVVLSNLSGNITISPSGTVAVNTELTAAYSGSETVTYQWKRGNTTVGTNSNKYMPTETGNYTVIVSATGYNSKTSATVTINATQLTANTWADGDLPTSSDVQWFKFTAVASTQYIHVGFGTLNDMLIQVYDSNGNAGSDVHLYYSTDAWYTRFSKSVTSGQEYYIKVRSYSSSNKGTYRIAVNTSTTTPTLNLSNLSGTITISPNSGVIIHTELTATYSGSETVKYQWKKNGNSVGTNSNKFIPTEVGSYTVTVEEPGYSYNSKTSAAVTVTLPNLSGNITISPSGRVIAGTELTATYSESETVSYQWKKDGNNIGGEVSYKYTPTTMGEYTVTVSRPNYNSKTSDPVTVVQWTAVPDSKFSNYIQAIAYGNNRFVAGDDGGKIAYSSTNNTATWTAVSDSKFDTHSIQAITYGNNMFVAVGLNGKLATSTNGIEWTDRTFRYGPYNHIYTITYANDMFIAGGYRGEMITSTDGVTWTAVSDSTFGTSGIRGIVYGNNMFVAVGDSGKMATSTDGVTWTAVSDSTFGTSAICGIVYGNNTFVAVGDSGKMATSTDGVTWTTVTNSTFGTSKINAIVFANNKFVAVGNDDKTAYSTDGTTWIAIPNSVFDSYIYAITYGNGRFVAGGRNGKMAYLRD